MVSGAAPTIVIVDDAADLRALVRTHLRLSGRLDVVAEGASGGDAIRLAAEHQPDLMLLDVSMPVMDGLEALPRVLEMSPSTRVVMFTGFDERGLVGKALGLGAAALLQKSVTMTTLADELITILLGDGVAPPAAGMPVQARAPATGPEDEPSSRGVLEEHLERFREVFEEAAIGMGTMTLTGRLVRANKAMSKLVGRPVEDLVGRSYASLMTSTGPARLQTVLQDVTEAGADVVQLEHGLLAGGHHRRVVTTLAPVRDAQRRALYVFVQAQDVTDQRATEEELRRSEERFRLLVETVSDYAIFMLDPQGYIVSWNAGAQRMKGYSAEEILGRHFRVFYPPEKQASGHPEHELELALRDGRYEEEGWRIRKGGGRFWADVLITSVHDAKGAHVGFAKVTRDITERRRLLDEQLQSAEALAAANNELEKANERLAQAAAERAQFLAVTAHELRTPLGVLGGSTELLREHWHDLDESERADLFDSMSASSARVRRLLDDLLTAARLEANAVALDLAEVNITDIVADCASAARRRHPDSEIVLDTPQVLRVVGDADRIVQAVDNLVNNALEHGVPPVRVGVGQRGRRVEVRVSDTGPGVSDEIEKRLFDRFVTGAQRGGTGLGLFIVRQLARAHDGDAWYEPAEDGSAATFVLSLPAVDDAAAPTDSSR